MKKVPMEVVVQALVALHVKTDNVFLINGGLSGFTLEMRSAEGGTKTFRVTDYVYGFPGLYGGTYWRKPVEIPIKWFPEKPEEYFWPSGSQMGVNPTKEEFRAAWQALSTTWKDAEPKARVPERLQSFGKLDREACRCEAGWFPKEVKKVWLRYIAEAWNSIGRGNNEALTPLLAQIDAMSGGWLVGRDKPEEIERLHAAFEKLAQELASLGAGPNCFGVEFSRENGGQLRLTFNGPFVDHWVRVHYEPFRSVSCRVEWGPTVDGRLDEALGAVEAFIDTARAKEKATADAKEAAVRAKEDVFASIAIMLARGVSTATTSGEINSLLRAWSRDEEACALVLNLGDRYVEGRFAKHCKAVWCGEFIGWLGSWKRPEPGKYTFDLNPWDVIPKVRAMPHERVQHLRELAEQASAPQEVVLPDGRKAVASQDAFVLAWRLAVVAGLELVRTNPASGSLYFSRGKGELLRMADHAQQGHDGLFKTEVVGPGRKVVLGSFEEIAANIKAAIGRHDSLLGLVAAK